LILKSSAPSNSAEGIDSAVDIYEIDILFLIISSSGVLRLIDGIIYTIMRFGLDDLK
jgi:hypothetical protein